MGPGQGQSIPQQAFDLFWRDDVSAPRSAEDCELAKLELKREAFDQGLDRLREIIDQPGFHPGVHPMSHNGPDPRKARFRRLPACGSA